MKGAKHKETTMTVNLTEDEKAIVVRLAKGEREVHDQANEIYLRHVRAHVESSEKTCYMNFLSEAFNVCPDFMLRSMYRKQVLAQSK
jgi:hypothetical protein